MSAGDDPTQTTPRTPRTPRTKQTKRRSAIEAGCGDALVELLDPDPIVRRYAVDAVALDAVGLYALRERLVEDSHGPVRAAVAERLARAARAIFDEGPPTRAEATQWIVEALSDPLSSVRELSCRVALRHGDRESGATLEAKLAELLVRDPVWRVRRAAARALAGVAGEAAIVPLIRGLEDPFWRVRHGVIQALALLVTRTTRDEGERARLRQTILEAGAGLQEAARAALAYLASGWPEGEDEVPEVLGLIRDPGAGLELSDADPAVVTARLQAQAADGVDASELVVLLAESHVPLREEAARRLAVVEDPSSLLPALAWLEDPRVPNAPAAVRGVLDRLGRRAEVLVEAALASGRSGALIWASAWIATHAAERFHGQLRLLSAHELAKVRAAAVVAIGRLLEREADDELQAIVEGALHDPSGRVRDAAASALCSGHGGRSVVGLVSAELFASLGPRARAEVAGAGLSPSLWRLALADRHARVRVAALGAAPVELDASLRAQLLVDPDPWIRRAALDVAAATASFLAGDEGDPGVRRGAARVLVRGRAGLDAELRSTLAAALLADVDPWIRARGAELIEAQDCNDAELCLLLQATRDRVAMARLSASATLDLVPELPARLEALLAGYGGQGSEYGSDRRDELRVAAWSRLLLGLDPDAGERRLQEARASESSERVRAHLDELAALFGAEAPRVGLAAVEARAPWTPPEPASVPRRALGQTGLRLAPMIVSGAFSLTPSALALAAERGVDTFFWEPRYANATRFLRQPQRRDLQVVAGSFHADRRGLTQDLDTARRRLQRDQIDLFLLFWVRSPARLGREALDTLREFQAKGWIRSYGLSTHERPIACAAIETGDWPVIMTRHSAAHTGAEAELLPLAAAAGVGVISFSNLCYGRMLQPSAVFERGPAAADCYRYSLAQPAVAACVSAPRRPRELRDNLAVLGQPALGDDMQAALRAHGREIYADNKRFDRLLRRGGTAPLREALLELFERASAPADAAVDSSER